MQIDETSLMIKVPALPFFSLSADLVPYRQTLFQGTGLYFISQSDNPSSPALPHGIRHTPSSSQTISSHTWHSVLLFSGSYPRSLKKHPLQPYEE